MSNPDEIADMVDYAIQSHWTERIFYLGFREKSVPAPSAPPKNWFVKTVKECYNLLVVPSKGRGINVSVIHGRDFEYNQSQRVLFELITSSDLIIRVLRELETGIRNCCTTDTVVSCCKRITVQLANGETTFHHRSGIPRVVHCFR